MAAGRIRPGCGRPWGRVRRAARCTGRGYGRAQHAHVLHLGLDLEQRGHSADADRHGPLVPFGDPLQVARVDHRGHVLRAGLVEQRERANLGELFSAQLVERDYDYKSARR